MIGLRDTDSGLTCDFGQNRAQPNQLDFDKILLSWLNVLPIREAACA